MATESSTWRPIVPSSANRNQKGQVQDTDDFDPNGARKMSRRVVQQLLRMASGTFITPQYNTSLYLNSQGFGGIQGLEEYTGCKVLHLEGNCLRKIEGLSHMTSLRALFLQTNDISLLEGMENCTQLEHLDISSNPIHSLSGLPPSLSTLHASSIGLERDDAILNLALMCPDLQVLDISRNRLQDTVLKSICKLTKLRVLYAKENPFTQSANYRRILVSSLPYLTYLDAQPVDDLERAGAEAWVVGGRAAEVAARQAWREERRKALKRTTATFAVERAQRRVLRELQGVVQSDEQMAWLMGMIEGPLQPDSVPRLVSRMMGESRTPTVPAEALEMLPMGLYRPDGAASAIRATANGANAGNQETMGADIDTKNGLEDDKAIHHVKNGYSDETNLLESGNDEAQPLAEECVVCSEELETGTSVLWLPCSHVFHERCIRQWLTGFSNTCPTCRAVAIPTTSTTTDLTAGPFFLPDRSSRAESPPHTSPAAPMVAGHTTQGMRESPLRNNGVISTNRIVSSILAEVCSTLSIPAPSTVPARQSHISAVGPALECLDCGEIRENSSSALSESDSQITEESDIGLGCAAANTLDDATYKQLQTMFKQSFGRKSTAAESTLAGWLSMKESRRHDHEGKSTGLGRNPSRIGHYEEKGMSLTGPESSLLLDSLKKVNRDTSRLRSIDHAPTMSSTQKCVGLTESKAPPQTNPVMRVAHQTTDSAVVQRTPSNSRLQQSDLITTASTVKASSQSISNKLEASGIQEVIRAVEGVMLERSQCSTTRNNPTGVPKLLPNHILSLPTRKAIVSRISPPPKSTQQISAAAQTEVVRIPCLLRLPQADDSDGGMDEDPWDFLPQVHSKGLHYI